MEYEQIITELYQTRIPALQGIAYDYIWFDAVSRIMTGLLCVPLGPLFLYYTYQFYLKWEDAPAGTVNEFVSFIVSIASLCGVVISNVAVVEYLLDRWAWIALFRPDLALIAKIVEVAS